MSQSAKDAIEGLRGEIDLIDDNILELLNQRAKVALEIGRFKARGQAELPSLQVEGRERAILIRLETKNSGLFPAVAIRSVFSEIFRACLDLQKNSDEPA
jgi:chorismate mutase/prephenate dehydratase